MTALRLPGNLVKNRTKGTKGSCDSVTPKKKRSISFDLERNTTKTIDCDFSDIEEQIWFTADEYVRIKSTSREESRAWRRQGYGQLLNETFERPGPNTQMHLNALSQLPEDMSRRGLERHLSKQHAEERSDRKDASRQAVFRTQDRLRGRSWGPMTDDIANRIAAVYKDQVEIAIVFARRIAQADELVVKDGENAEAAMQVLEEHCTSHRRMERRMSNYSTMSMNSMDSRRRFQQPQTRGGKSRRCPSSPASAMEEYYAAIA